MKNQALCSSKDKSKTIKCRLLQFLFGALSPSPSINHYKTDTALKCRLMCFLWHTNGKK